VTAREPSRRRVAAPRVAGVAARWLGLARVLWRVRRPRFARGGRLGQELRASVRSSGLTVLQLEQDEELTVKTINREAGRAVRYDKAAVICLGCGGMACLDEAVRAETGVPVVDGGTSAVKLAESLVALGLSTRRPVPAVAALLPQRRQPAGRRRVRALGRRLADVRARTDVRQVAPFGWFIGAALPAVLYFVIA
jgi:Asp/Glu/Hydantoin racemase